MEYTASWNRISVYKFTNNLQLGAQHDAANYHYGNLWIRVLLNIRTDFPLMLSSNGTFVFSARGVYISD